MLETTITNFIWFNFSKITTQKNIMFGYDGRIPSSLFVASNLKIVSGVVSVTLVKRRYNRLEVNWTMPNDSFVKSKIVHFWFSFSIDRCWKIVFRFREKTSNDFYHRDTFVKHGGKYDFVQLDYNPTETKKKPEPETQKNGTEPPVRTVPDSKLDKRVQNLIELVCNVRAMEEALLEMKFDAKKNPLGWTKIFRRTKEIYLCWNSCLIGKLSSAQIKAGYAALKDIEQFIKVNDFGAAFVEANNTYYTRSKKKKINFKSSFSFVSSTKIVLKFLMNSVDKLHRWLKRLNTWNVNSICYKLWMISKLHLVFSLRIPTIVSIRSINSTNN